MADIVTPVIGELVGFLVKPISQRCSDFVNYNDNIEALRDQVKALKKVREDVEESIVAARNKGDEIKNEVQYWILRFERVVREAENFLEDDTNANKRCFYGWFPNLVTRYQLSRQLEKKKTSVTEVKNDGKFPNVSKPAPPPGVLLPPSTQYFILFESTKVAMTEAMEALKDSKINFVGIHGMGGVGKTTLVKEIAKMAQEDGLFDVVLMAVVPQSVDVKQIQDQIADMLGVTLKHKKRSEQGRAGELRARLMKVQKILVVLDGLWDKLDLAAIGIPFGNDHLGCKIVVTTRRKQVCYTMMWRSEASKIIHLGVISERESVDLLKTIVGRSSVVDYHEWNSVAKDICKECGGLPIALTTAGRAMRGKDLEGWREAALELRQARPTNIEGMNEDVYKCLKLSYEYLRDREAKSMFLLCCLFPEDDNISIEGLVRYGIGVGMFADVQTIQQARRRAHSIVNNLIDSCLLLPGNETGLVKMHDVVRDAAISIASNAYLVKARAKLQEWPDVETLKHYTGISVMQNQIKGYPTAWECSDLQILLMQGNPIEILMPEKVFQGMKALRVLDQSGTFHGNLQFSGDLKLGFAHLTNLRTLIMKDCVVADAAALGMLKMLEILCLAQCRFLNPPNEIGELTNIRMIDLKGCRLGEQFDPLFPRNVISRWSRLEELYASSYFTYSEEHIAELASLSRLTTLTMDITNFGCMPQGFIFRKLEVFKISIGSSSSTDVELAPTNYLEVCGLIDGGSETMLSVASLACVEPLLKTIKSLKVSFFKELTNIFPCLSSDGDGLAYMKSLEIRYCDEIECLINTEERRGIPRPAPAEQHHQWTCLCELERLDLWDLIAFKGLCHGELPAEMLSKLKSLNFYKCQKLSIVFYSLKLLKRFDELEELGVSSCQELECVFSLKPERPVLDEGKEMLPRLRELTLMDLPEFKRICKGPIPTGLMHNLQIAKIHLCRKLNMLFHASIAQSLVLLKKLEVSACDQLQTVVSQKQQGLDLEVAIDNVSFPQLIEVSLSSLPNLIGFCIDSLAFTWPYLENVTVFDCPKMNTFAVDGNQSTPKLKQIKVDGVEIMLDGRSLNNVIHGHYVRSRQ